MPNSMVIKWLHRALTATLLLLVAGFLLFQHYATQQPDDELYSQQQISPDVYLYVTKYKNANATVSDVYRYYIDSKQQGDVLAYLKKKSPFLVADSGNAKVTGDGSQISADITGRVYAFTNSSIFYADGNAVIPVINLKVTGTR